MRRRIHEILTTPRADDRFGRAVGFLLFALVAANVVASVLETDDAIRASAPEAFARFEQVSVVVFTLEYVLRLWACTADPRYRGPGGRVRYALTPMVLIDLLAIAPSYIVMFAPGAIDLRFLRVLRLLRLFRLLRVRPVRSAFTTLSRAIRAKRAELGITLALVMVATVLAAGAMYFVERDVPGTQFTSIPRAMWWSIVTITTVGYGDVVPATALGHVLAGIVAFIGICTLALPVGIISSSFIEELDRQRAATPATPTVAAGPHCGETLDAPPRA